MKIQTGSQAAAISHTVSSSAKDIPPTEKGPETPPCVTPVTTPKMTAMRWYDDPTSLRGL